MKITIDIDKSTYKRFKDYAKAWDEPMKQIILKLIKGRLLTQNLTNAKRYSRNKN